MRKVVNAVRRSMVGAIAIVAVAATPGFAAPTRPGETRTSVEVSYADVNLASERGQAVLESRVRQAAQKVCGYAYGSRDLAEAAHGRACMKQALGDARMEMAAVIGGATRKAKQVATAEPFVVSAPSGI